MSYGYGAAPRQGLMGYELISICEEQAMESDGESKKKAYEITFLYIHLADKN